MKFIWVLVMCVAVARAAPLEDGAADDEDSVHVDAAPDADLTTDSTADTTSDSTPAAGPLVDLSAPHTTYVDPLHSISLQVPDADRSSGIYTLFSGHSSPYEYVPIHVKLEKEAAAVPVGPTWAEWAPLWHQWGHFDVLPARK